MSVTLEALANRKHLETGHDEVTWFKALETAQESLKSIAIDTKSLETLALASRTPTSFVVLNRLIYQYGKSHANGAQIGLLVIELANNSPFSLKDWIGALEFFNSWLQERDQKIDLLPMLRYLECCGAAPDAKESGQTLLALLEDMLNVCGYEAGRPKAST